MKLYVLIICELLVVLSYSAVAWIQSVLGQTMTGPDVKSIETIQFLIQNQIIGFVGGAVSVIIAIATYLMSRRAADERRDESLNLRIKDFSRNEVEKLRLEMLSKFAELQMATQQTNSTIATVLQDIVKLESELAQLKIDFAKLSALKDRLQ